MDNKTERIWIGWPDAEHPEVVDDEEVAAEGPRGAKRFVREDLAKPLAQCLDHALEMGHLTPGGSTEAWAKEVLKPWRKILEEDYL